MGLTCITYILQLINLGLLFRLIFSYGFRENRGAMGIGIILILISLCARLGFLSAAPVELQLFAGKGLFMALPAFLFEGSLLRLFLLGINYSLLVKFVFTTVSYGMQFFDIYTLNAGILTQLLFFFAFVGVGFFLKKKNISLNRHMEDVNLMLLMVSLLGLILLNWNGGVAYADPERDVTLLLGWTRFLTIVISILFLGVIVGAQLLLAQKKQLSELNLQQKKCITEQTLQYHRLEEKDTELRSFKHDYKAHFAMIQSYLEYEDVESARQYMGEIGTIESTFHIHKTGNFIMDAILNQYAELGEKAGIAIRVLGKMPEDAAIAETDLCTLFFNGMENAFEAISLREGKGTIQVEITNNQGYVFIEIENPSSRKIAYSAKGLLSSKKEPHHGIGTRNMISVAEKYHGDVKWHSENGQVITKIKLKYK